MPKSDGASLVEGLFRKLKGIQDPGMRAAVVAEFVQSVDLSASAGILESLFEGSRTNERHKAAWRAFALALEQGLFEYDWLRDVYAALVEREAGTVAATLLMGERRHGERPPVPIRPGERPLTLGERKALARRPDRRLLERLARDPDPRVVRILLSNPRVVEQDVMRIAAARPANPDTLVEVARHPRWNNRVTVLRALVFNPHTPEATKLRILPKLRKQDLREVANGGTSVGRAVAEAARRLVALGVPKEN